jgi:hypothetical protein
MVRVVGFVGEEREGRERGRIRVFGRGEEEGSVLLKKHVPEPFLVARKEFLTAHKEYLAARKDP